MDDKRYKELDESGQGLTQEEMDQGWHWCGNWDDMLVGPGTEEASCCHCDIDGMNRWKKSQAAMIVLAKLDEELGI